MKRIILLGVVAALAGCAAKTSPEAHARHYAYQADESSNPQYVVDHNSIYQLNLDKFKQVYQHGKDDKTQGMDVVFARNTAKLIYDAAYNAITTDFFKGHPGQSVEVQSSTRDAKVFAEELSATYLDGYYGK